MWTQTNRSSPCNPCTRIANNYRQVPSPGRMPSFRSQLMNQQLKQLRQRAELNTPTRIIRIQGAKPVELRGPTWQFLTTHVARKTFVTISSERGMRAEVVMSVTGHRSFKTMKRSLLPTNRNATPWSECVEGESRGLGQKGFVFP